MDDKPLNIERVVTGPMELVHWPDCRGGDACRCAASGSVLMRGVGRIVRREEDETTPHESTQ